METRGVGWRVKHPSPSHPGAQTELGGERGSRAGMSRGTPVFNQGLWADGLQSVW